MIKRMSDDEMLEAVLTIYKNINYYRNPKMYQQMMILLEEILYFLKSDLQIEYPIEQLEAKSQVYSIENIDFDF